MSIQASINQGLSLLSLLGSQTSRAAVKRQQAVDESKLKQYEKQAEFGKEPETEGEVDVQLDIAKTGAEASKMAFQQNPSEATFKQYNIAAQDVAELANQKSQMRAKAEAEQAAELAAEQQRLARSREITRSLTEGIPMSLESQKYVQSRIEKGGK